MMGKPGGNGSMCWIEEFAGGVGDGSDGGAVLYK